MNHSERQLETARDHIADLRLQASLRHELQAAIPRFKLRRRIAHALRNLAASLEPEIAKTATLS